MSLIKQMSEDFNIGIDELLDGEKKKTTRQIDYKYLKGCNIWIINNCIYVFIMLLSHNDNYQFKTLSTKCEDFNISGTVSYNDKKSSIFL